MQIHTSFPFVYDTTIGEVLETKFNFQSGQVCPLSRVFYFEEDSCQTSLQFFLGRDTGSGMFRVPRVRPAHGYLDRARFHSLWLSHLSAVLLLFLCLTVPQRHSRQFPQTLRCFDLIVLGWSHHQLLPLSKCGKILSRSVTKLGVRYTSQLFHTWNEEISRDSVALLVFGQSHTIIPAISIHTTFLSFVSSLSIPNRLRFIHSMPLACFCIFTTYIQFTYKPLAFFQGQAINAP